MSESHAILKTAAPLAGQARAADPDHNPTYPKRTHLLERAQLEEDLRLADQRLNSALQKLNVLSDHAKKPLFVRLCQQMQGARDQLAEAVRRLPMEVGGLYHEDHERWQQAKDAMDRIWRQWEKAGG